MSCSNEAHGHDHHDHEHDHGHGHGHGHEGHDHDDPVGTGPQDSLYSQIDLPHVTALNASGGPEDGQKVIKSWDLRDDEEVYLESDADDTLIINIPFISSVSLRTITIKSGPSGQTPIELHLFKNTPGMDFSDAESKEPTQKLECIEHRDGVEYQVKAAKFAGTTSLTIYIPGNTSEGDEETTKVFYIGLRGSWIPIAARPGAIIYESAARPTDHKLEGVTEGQSWGPGY